MPIELLGVIDKVYDRVMQDKFRKTEINYKWVASVVDDKLTKRSEL